MRRLPSWVLSYAHHKATEGVWPEYAPLPMPSVDEMVESSEPDEVLGWMTSGGRLPVDRWLRTESLADDVAAFLVEIGVDPAVARTAADSVPWEGKPYDHDIGRTFTDAQVAAHVRASIPNGPKPSDSPTEPIYPPADVVRPRSLEEADLVDREARSRIRNPLPAGNRGDRRARRRRVAGQLLRRRARADRGRVRESGDRCLRRVPRPRRRPLGAPADPQLLVVSEHPGAPARDAGAAAADELERSPRDRAPAAVEGVLRAREGDERRPSRRPRCPSLASSTSASAGGAWPGSSPATSGPAT